jgi:RHS repeat-associated protein
LKMFEHGLTNNSKGVISGQTHPINNSLTFDNKGRKNCHMTLGSNEQHSFVRLSDDHKYYLKELVKPNQMKFHYFYEDKKLRKIELRNRANGVISYAYVHTDLLEKATKKTTSISISSPDNRIVHYKFEDFSKKREYYVLTDVIRTDGPPVHYVHDEAHYRETGTGWSGNMERIKRKELPNGRCTEIDYYCKGDNTVVGLNFKIKDYKSDKLNRVKEIKQPAGVDQKLIPTYKFWYDIQTAPYSIKTSMAFDAYNRRTDYKFNQNDRLIEVLKYDERDQHYSSERLFWQNTDSKNQINLCARAFGKPGNGEKYFARLYHYDSKGNILHDVLYGCLTGTIERQIVINDYGTPVNSDLECKIVSYTHTGAHLVATKKEENIIIQYGYIPNTSLKSYEFHRDSNGIYRRHFYDYNNDSQVVLHISDDGSTEDRNSLVGATERIIDRTTRLDHYPYGLPEREVRTRVDLATGQELPVHTRVQHFESRGHMVRQETYGSDGQLAFIKHWNYDDYGNLLTETDSLGYSTNRQYDANGNCIVEEGPLPGVRKEMAYDYMNRLITIRERHQDGIVLTQSFSYDYVGNKISSVDGFGNVTNYQYDAFGRVISQTGPGIESLQGNLTRASTKYEYNELSQPIKQTDSYGNSILTKFTLFGKPYEVHYPDGTREQMKYNLRGELVESRSAIGATTRYIRDDRGRVIRTELYSIDGELYSQTEAIYDQTRLLQEIDSLGNITTYDYDAYGRLSTVQREGEVIQYGYDSLGRQNKETHSNPEGTQGTVVLKTFDAKGQLLSKVVQDLSGTTYSESQYKYDEIGRTIYERTGDAISTYKHDSHGLCVESTDPEGNHTTTSARYDYINSFGQGVLKTTATDPNGVQTVTTYDAKGQKSVIEMFNAQGDLLRSSKHIYDLNGNLLQTVTTPDPARVYRYTYDAMSRLVDTVHAYGTSEQKTFTTRYNTLGLKESFLKPDGVSMRFEYDGLGRLAQLFSSDNSVSYSYVYDVNNNPIDTINNLTGKTCERLFDNKGRVLHEVQQNGLTTSFSYCYDGAIQTMTLPDGSSVAYAYEAGYLKRATRYDVNGIAKYEHQIHAYDSQGNIISEQLPNSLGKIGRTFSLRGDLLSCNSPYFEETDAEYDRIGNLISRKIKDRENSKDEHYAYDDLNQLNEENGNFNHTYTHDAHQNRLTKDSAKYNVNLLNQILSDETDTFSYDLNGNLIAMGNIRCSYDALDRLSKVHLNGKTASYQYDELNRCIERADTEGVIRFFYLNQTEIGACNSQGDVEQFLLPGPGRESAPCQALSIELNGSNYAALHDQSGHLRALVDHSNKSASYYRYSAFGEQEHFGPAESPWTFAGKRQDPLTKWIHFGRRYYLPTIGRFLTPDPAGLSVSPNLYAYLANSPLIRYDTYGLYESSAITSLQNFARHTMHIASTLIAAPFTAANGVRKFAGHVIYNLSRNVVPLPVLQDIPQAAGYFLAHSNLRDYTFSLMEKDFDVIEGNGSIKDGERRLAIAGIGNTREDAIAWQQWAQEANGGVRTDVLYGPTHGLARDLVECLLEKIGVRTSLVERAEERLKNTIDEVGPNGVVKIDAHSRGGLNLACVLPNLTHDQVSRLWINTYGSATIIDHPFVKHVTNHISAYEWVTGIADPYSFAVAVFKPQNHVKFHHSHSFLVEHSVLSDTYKNAFIESTEKFDSAIVNLR